MALSAIARFTRSIGRHCMARPAGAALMALALGGAVAGGALAISPTIETTRVFRGGISIVTTAVASASVLAYTVPAGRKFSLTDLVIANDSDTSPAADQQVLMGLSENCDFADVFRTNSLKVPAGGTLHVPFVTGIGFTAGQHVCIRNGELPATGGSTTFWTIRGFLFE
jgi:hypothetical protein